MELFILLFGDEYKENIKLKFDLHDLRRLSLSDFGLDNVYS